MTMKDFFSTGEAASVLNISRSTISRKFDRGMLQGKKNAITGERFVSRESIEAFAKEYDFPLDALAMARKKILLATPDEELYSLAQRVATGDERVQVDRVTFGGDALIRCSKEHPDLVVLDEELADIPCPEVIRSLKRMEDLKDTRILCVTKTRTKRCLEWGADDALSKGAMEQGTLAGSVYSLLEIPEDRAEIGRSFEHQRRWPRVNLRLPAKLSVYPLSRPYRRDGGETVLENISFGGSFLSGIKLNKGALPGEPFRFLLEVDHAPLMNWRAHCKVVRLQADASLSAGVQFVRLSRANRQMLETICR